MSYQYAQLKPALFTDEGQRTFLKFRDATKCKGAFGYNTDQLLHIMCKLAWVAVLLIWPSTGVLGL